MKAALLHPFLLGMFPVLFLYAQNATEMSMADVLTPLGLVVMAVIILQALLVFVIRDTARRSILISVVMLLFFGYGHLYRIGMGLFSQSPSATAGNITAIVVIVLIVAGVLIFLLRTKRTLQGLTRAFNAAAVILVVLQVGLASHALITRPGNEIATVISAETPPGVVNRPDIYFLVFDAFGREDVLREMFSVDNSWFVDSLRRRGFFVVDSAVANYCATLQSVAATMNFNYVHELGNFDPESFDRGPLSRLLAHNKVMGDLTPLGYKYVTFASGHRPTEIHSAHYYFEPSFVLSEFHNVLLGYTPIPYWISEEKSPFALHRRRVEYILDKLTDLDNIRDPKFVFAHLVCPHPPCVFDENGGAVQRDWGFSFADGDHYTDQGGDMADYKNGYGPQVLYLSKRIIEVVDGILAQSGTPPIIVIQGDHGPGTELSWSSLAKSNVHERFPILNAYYLPDGGDSLLSHNITPVNSFRVILNEYFGKNYPMLPQRVFYTTRARPYKYYEVTDSFSCLADSL